MWLFATSQLSIPEFGLPFEGKGNPYLLVLEDCDQQLLYIGIQHVLCVYISPIWKRKYDERVHHAFTGSVLYSYTMGKHGGYELDRHLKPIYC